MVIGCSIRAGREQAVKTAMMEGGHVLPEPGEGAAWLAKVGPLLGHKGSGRSVACVDPRAANGHSK
jgi:hypothetical protein